TPNGSGGFVLPSTNPIVRRYCGGGEALRHPIADSIAAKRMLQSACCRPQGIRAAPIRAGIGRSTGRIGRRPACYRSRSRGVSPAGSHKPNTAVAQVFDNTDAGRRKITAEIGAGPWGSIIGQEAMALPGLPSVAHGA